MDKPLPPVPTNFGEALSPSSMGEVMEFARMLARSSMVPKDYQGKPENILVAVQWGREVGLGPLQALQNISVINGRPAIWGDAMLALVRGSPKCAYVKESMEGENESMIATCRCARRDQDGEIVSTFSVADAKKANLWSKAGTWAQYPQRMLQMRARGFALRDAFADVLRGVISIEEARDIPVDPSRPTPRQEQAHAVANERMKAAGEALAKEAAGAQFIGLDGLTDDEREAPEEPASEEALQVLRALKEGRAMGGDAYVQARKAYAQRYEALSAAQRAHVINGMMEQD